MLAYQFYVGKTPRTYENLVDSSLFKSFPFWTYRQIRHFLSTQGTTLTWTRQLTPFEELCTRSSPQRHLISYMYNALIDNTTYTPDSTHTAWEVDLQMTFTEEDWTRINEYIHKGSLNVAIQENGYKIQTRWNRTPSLLHKFSPTIPDTCWRCGKAKGTMLHIWWDCDSIQPF